MYAILHACLTRGLHNLNESFIWLLLQVKKSITIPLFMSSFPLCTSHMTEVLSHCGPNYKDTFLVARKARVLINICVKPNSLFTVLIPRWSNMIFKRRCGTTVVSVPWSKQIEMFPFNQAENTGHLSVAF